MPATPAPCWRSRGLCTPVSLSVQRVTPASRPGPACCPWSPLPPRKAIGLSARQREYVCHDCWAEGLPAEPPGPGRACLRPRRLCSPSQVPGAWQEVMYIPWTEG